MLVKYKKILETNQTVTGSWVDVGEVFTVVEAKTIAAAFEYDPGNSVGLKARLVVMYDSDPGSKIIEIPIERTTSEKVSLTPLVVSLPTDDNHYIAKGFDLIKVFPFAKIQIMADTPGTTPAIFSEVVIFNSSFFLERQI